MSTRQETEQRRKRLRQELRQACLQGVARPGEPLPPLSELAERHGLSVNVVRQAVQGLQAEGLLHIVPRVGTFVGRPAHSGQGFYLLLLSKDAGPEAAQLHQMRSGFEDRIGALGGASLVMSAASAAGCAAEGGLPQILGVFEPEGSTSFAPGLTLPEGVPHTQFKGRAAGLARTDWVSFDDALGGRQATQHLLSLGHRRIAFLALHPAEGDLGDFAWSAERETGWCQALRAEGLSTESLGFHPPTAPASENQRQSALSTAAGLLRRPDVTAVVAANDWAALGFLQCLQAAGLSPDQWPAVVGFDDDLSSRGCLVTSLRLPWDEIGRDAADLLWDRSHGRAAGPPEHRRVPMRLVPRLTSRPGWTRLAGDALLETLREPAASSAA